MWTSIAWRHEGPREWNCMDPQPSMTRCHLEEDQDRESNNLKHKKWISKRDGLTGCSEPGLPSFILISSSLAHFVLCACVLSWTYADTPIKAPLACEKSWVKYRKFLYTAEWNVKSTLKSSWVLAGQGIRLLSLGENPTTGTVCSTWDSFPCLDQVHLSWKCHIDCKPTCQCLVLPGRLKSGVLTHSAKTVKEW